MPFGINVIGYLQSEKGLGEAVRGLLRALDAAAIPYALNDFPDHGSANLLPIPSRPSGLLYDVSLVAINPDNLPHFARCVDMAHLRRGRYRIGSWHWELPEFPAAWSDRFQYFDEIWVGSSFTQDAVARASSIPVLRMPPAFELNPVIEPIPRSTLGLAEDAFVFLFAFDAASTLARKNPTGLAKALRTAFPTDSNVQLIL